MKHLKLYEDYNNSDFITDYDEAVQWLEDNWNDVWDVQFDPSKLTKNDDGTFDYDGSIYLGSKDKRIDRIAVEFNYVTGDFDCVANNLVTLEGTPRHVEGSFWCSHNNLATLEGSPRYVGDSFYCGYNNLATLEGSPRYVGGGFSCYHNMLTKKDSKYSLEYGNPGSEETDITKIAENFLKKLKTEERCKGHEARILKSLKQYKPEVFKVVMDVADFDLDYWINNIEKASKHDDIIDL